MIIRSSLGTPVINRAAQFWINWIFFMLLSDVLDHTVEQLLILLMTNVSIIVASVD